MVRVHRIDKHDPLNQARTSGLTLPLGRDRFDGWGPRLR
jgi:hypothetical protein